MDNRSKSPFDQLNLSTAKQQYSFSRGSRFETQAQPIKYSPRLLLSDKYYDLPSIMGQGRKAGIGIGGKCQLGTLAGSEAPSPTKYDLGSMFNSKTARGTKFGFGREELKIGGIFRKSSTPGPATYTIPSKVREHPEITLKPRLKDSSLINLANPGPGTCTHYS